MNQQKQRIYLTPAVMWLLLAAASASAQTVTTTIPASFTPAVAAAVNLARNKIYVASAAGSNAGSVTVINGATNSYTTIPYTTINASNPQAVAVNPISDKVYVANAGTGNVTVISSATDAITTLVGVGNGPLALAANPLTNKIYVANNTDGTVSVIDGSTDTVAATVTVGSSPAAVAVNPATNLIYVANSGSGTVSVINGANNTVVASPSGATSPIALSVDAVTNKIYVGDSGSNNLMVIDGATNNVTTVSAGVDGYGKAVVVNPVTNTVYLADIGSGVSIFAGATATSAASRTTVLTVGNSPNALAVDPVTNRIYTANNSTSDVSVIDGSTNTVVTTVADPNALGPYAAVVNPVTDKIYVTNSVSNNVTVVDGATNSISPISDSSAQGPTAVAVNPVTGTAYVANNSSNNVTVIAGGAYSSTVTTGTTPTGLAANPVTGAVYVANAGSNNVTVIGPDNTVVTAIADPNAQGPSAVAVNPVTNTIYVANNTSGNVTVINGANYTVLAAVTDPTALSPTAVAVNPVTNTAYVANYGSGTVTAIDGATNTVIASIAVGTNPTALVVNPVTNLIYVANYGSNNVSVIAGAPTNALVTTVSDPGALQPVALDVNPVTNLVYVANYGTNSDNPSAVTIINGADNTFISLADPYAGEPVSVVVNPTTNKIYVANSLASYPIGDIPENAVTVIDGATNSLSYVPFTAGVAPYALGVDPTANQIYVADSGTGSSDTIITEQQALQTIPITAKITALTGNQTGSFTPTFTFTASNTFTTASIDNLLFLVDTWQTPWTVGQGSGNYTGTTTATLQPGFHYLYAYATEGEEATSTSAGPQNSPVIGSIAAYGFLVAAPEPSISPSSLNFTSQAVGTASPEQILTLTNSGSVPLSITSVAFSETNAAWSESDTCVLSSPLAPAATCTVNVSFTPSAIGTAAATLVLTDNAGDVVGSQQTVMMSGTGVQATTTTAVTASVNPSSPGQQVTFTATVTPQGSGTPTGTVTFNDGATAICTSIALSASQATCSTSTLAIGSHSFTAVYSGDSNFLGSTSAAWPQIVSLASATVTLGSLTQTYTGSPLTPTATTTPAGLAITWTGAPQTNPGTYAVTATVNSTTYQGSASGTFTLNKAAPVIGVTSNPPSPSVVGQPLAIAFTVTVTPPVPGAATVTVSDGTGDTCTGTVAAGSCVLTPTTAGSKTITATYGGDSNFNSSSGTTAQTVNPAATTTKVTGSTPSSPIIGQIITVSYTVTINAPGAGSIPGADTVTVTDGTGASCTGTVASGSCALVPKAIGSDTLSATYNGDANLGKSTGTVGASFTVAQVINLTGLTATPTPDQSTSVGLSLTTPATTPLTGTLTLSFASNAAGTPQGYMDPMTCFVDSNSQCVTQINFTVPVGGTVASIANNGLLQQGTTAGTITVTLSSLMAGSTSVLPQPPPTRSVVIAPIAPAIKSVSITNVTSTGFNVQVTAYSTPRDLGNATFTFTAAAGTNLNGSSPPPVALSTSAQPYFASSNGLSGGGTFILTVPFTFNGDTSAIGGVAVTLSNSVGTSSSVNGD
jgi:YVTN family beta-propeller protein